MSTQYNLISKYEGMRQHLKADLEASDKTVKQLVAKGLEWLRANGYGDGSVVMVDREIRRATRPLGHHKNKWGLASRCGTGANGMFGVKYAESKFGKVNTMADVEKAGFSRYQPLSKSQRNKVAAAEFNKATKAKATKLNKATKAKAKVTKASK